MGVISLQPGSRPMFPDPWELRPFGPGLVALGGDLEPETLLEAYRKGNFPWEAGPPIPWFSPDPRLILVPRGFRASDSLRKLGRQGKLRVTFDRDFAGVIRGCAAMPRPGQAGTWITAEVIAAYTELHRRGVVHSVETWEGEALVGGLYGLAIGKAFFGESMFARRSDASKLAFYALCRHLHAAGFHFVDCQQDTRHLRSLGAVTVPRLRYLRLLEAALSWPEAWPRVAERLAGT